MSHDFPNNSNLSTLLRLGSGGFSSVYLVEVVCLFTFCPRLALWIKAFEWVLIELLGEHSAFSWGLIQSLGYFRIYRSTQMFFAFRKLRLEKMLLPSSRFYHRCKSLVITSSLRNFHYCCRRDTQNTLTMFIFWPFLAKSHDFVRTNQTPTDSPRESQRRFLRCWRGKVAHKASRMSICGTLH